MAKKKKVTLYCFGRLLNVIFAIMPTNPFFGIITRILRRKWLGALLNLILFPIFYIADLVTVILYDKPMLLA